MTSPTLEVRLIFKGIFLGVEKRYTVMLTAWGSPSLGVGKRKSPSESVVDSRKLVRIDTVFSSGLGFALVVPSLT